MVERDSSVHVSAFVFVVTSSLHHVLWITEQSQVHQLVIETVLLGGKKTTTEISTVVCGRYETYFFLS